MPRKPIRNRCAVHVFALFAFLLAMAPCVAASLGDPAPTLQPKFLGANSCSSSSCHGGAGERQNQQIVWSTRDFHFQRPVATLTTARSKQISAVLNIKDPASDHQCVSCHTPLREVPENLRGDALRITEAVSCEVCHAPAENWLRSHTRTDYTHADRVLSGMRDLKNLYVRANTCVACHQNVSVSLLNAGHPELIFELDGQSVTEPKHWREKQNWQGAQAWAVGQSVALREMLWQLDATGSTDAKLIARTEALLWLFEKIDSAATGLPKSGLASSQIAKDKFREARAAADIFARELADIDWPPKINGSILKALLSGKDDFTKPVVFADQHARRAERLVLAIDRLCDPKSESNADAQIKNLFKLCQSIPDFNSSTFASALDSLRAQFDSR